MFESFIIDTITRTHKLEGKVFPAAALWIVILSVFIIKQSNTVTIQI